VRTVRPLVRCGRVVAPAAAARARGDSSARAVTRQPPRALRICDPGRGFSQQLLVGERILNLGDAVGEVQCPGELGRGRDEVPLGDRGC